MSSDRTVSMRHKHDALAERASEQKPWPLVEFGRGFVDGMGDDAADARRSAEAARHRRERVRQQCRAHSRRPPAMPHRRRGGRSRSSGIVIRHAAAKLCRRHRMLRSFGGSRDGEVARRPGQALSTVDKRRRCGPKYPSLVPAHVANDQARGGRRWQSGKDRAGWPGAPAHAKPESKRSRQPRRFAAKAGANLSGNSWRRIEQREKARVSGVVEKEGSLIENCIFGAGAGRFPA